MVAEAAPPPADLTALLDVRIDRYLAGRATSTGWSPPGEFALAWRGRYDDVVHGYPEVCPLTERDRALLTPALWSWVFLGVAGEIRRMTDGRVAPHRLEWQTKMLLRRSPLMGRHSVPYAE